MIEDGIYGLMQASIPDFQGVDDAGTPVYKVEYLAALDPLPPPYCAFRRYKRMSEIDLKSEYEQLVSNYVMSIYHNDSWALLSLQERIRALLLTLPLTTVGGIFVQQLQIIDDFHDIPPLIQEARSRVFTGILDFEIVHSPT